MSKEIQAIKKVLDGNLGDGRGAFVVLGERMDNHRVDVECYVDGTWDVILPAVAEEMSEIIVNGSEDEEQMRLNAMQLSHLVMTMCDGKWKRKAATPAVTGTIEITEELKRKILGEEDG